MIYDCIISGIQQEREGKESLTLYLKSLKSDVRMLRGAYRKKPVHVPYNKETVQSAYLITYFPHYYQLVEKILREKSPDNLCKSISINMSFFGGGPGPEVYGAIKYILFNNDVVKSITVNVLDINSDTWEYSHRVVKNSLIKDILSNRDVSITWNSYYLDLVDHFSVESHVGIIKNSDLIVIQNCVNEINTVHYPQLTRSVITIFENMPSQCSLLMIDLTSSVRSSIKLLQDEIIKISGFEEAEGTLNNSSSSSIVSLNSRPNEVVRYNLLTSADGLIPRKNLKYDYSLISKCAVRQRKDQSEAGLNVFYSPLSRERLGKVEEVKNRTFIGLDFGTSVSVCTMAYVQDNKIKLRTLDFEQKDRNGGINISPLVPSVMAVSNNHFMLGKYANEMRPMLKKDTDVWYGFKSKLGYLNSEKYPSSILGKYPLGRRISNAREGLEVYLNLIYEQVIRFVHDQNLPEDIYYSVSVPANFQEYKKAELRECLSKAGFCLEGAAFAQEPVSALICALYNVDVSIQHGEQKNVLVLDLGAGTVDISIMKLSFDSEGLNSEILSVQRISEIGGDKINELIYNELNLGRDFCEAEKESILCDCELLKVVMCKSFEIDSDFILPQVATSSSKKREISCNISSMVTLSLQFDVLYRVMKVYWEAVEKTISTAIDKAGIIVSLLDDVVLSGGGARNPYVKVFSNEYFYGSNIIIPDDIQEQVARGNALQCLVQNAFGKNMINSKLAQSVFVKNICGYKKIFEEGIIIPTLDFELDVSCVLCGKITIKYEKEEGEVQFIVPEEPTKIFLYLTADQEAKCEVVVNKKIASLVKVYIN